MITNVYPTETQEGLIWGSLKNIQYVSYQLGVGIQIFREIDVSIAIELCLTHPSHENPMQ